MLRRDFLRTGLAGGAGALSMLWPGAAGALSHGVALVVDPSDAVAASTTGRWATDHLRRTLSEAGVPARVVDRLGDLRAGERGILCAGAESPAGAAGLASSGAAIGTGPERLALAATRYNGHDVVLAAGTDPRGLSYALLELADRVRTAGEDAAGPLDLSLPIVQAPANPVRSVMRQFTSDVLDTPWLTDRAMWPEYLTLLATHRFNRLHLGFGLGYDTLRGVRDSYLLFLYPFLVAVPGYDVRVTNLSDAERDRNLDTLRDISEQTAARGLTFQLGIWMHGHELVDSPAARYVVQGLTPASHAAYCRDALTTVLRACPAISAVALRIHGESGVAEGSYDFWQTVFEGVPKAGRTIEIDLHSKGLDETMIGRALATGMPVNVSPKYWAEHLGMPYHQAAIRDLEMPVAGQTGRGLMTLSEGSLSFTRYGYASFLRDDRRYTVRHRVFAGTQRLLLSGDPAGTAAYGRAFQFCGSTGMDLMEPLTCRGRRGTGIAGSRRSGYADAALEPRWDWQKYEYWYRVWGRLTYDPDAGPDEWRRYFEGDPDAARLETALSRVSRVLPIVTTAHLPSAACDAYWPEVYWNQPMVAEPRPNPYGDSPAPKTFQHVSPLDPQLFSSIDQHAGELLSGESTGRYSPIEAAQWLEDLAGGAAADLDRVSAASSPAVRRLVVDAWLQVGLARFFAAKLRAGVLYALHERTGARPPLEAALVAYRSARAAWADLAARAESVYAGDLSVSDKISERGHWRDRLAAVDADIGQMEARLASAGEGDAPVSAAVVRAQGRPVRPVVSCDHAPPARFTPGEAVRLDLRPRGADVMSVVCHYRHVNQAERFEPIGMRQEGGSFSASIPAAYTRSPFPLQYYFTVTLRSGETSLYPGLGTELMDQPYFVVRRVG
jgi:hypothetical protein